ncbi:MAG: TonB C-terminal domain-containing protein [Lentisphaeria bacterium]|nr:TonB C-terminal domain-containing protein [Lentisphaeria bacterium]
MMPQFSPGELAASGRDPYENSGRFTRIAIFVVILHIALFVVPWIWFTFLKPQENKVFVMRAALAEMPKGNSPEVPPAIPGKKPVPDLPEIPEIPEIPAQKLPELPEKPRPVPPKQKPAVKPKPIPAPKKTPVKPKTKPEKKKKYLSAEDIRKSIPKQRNNPQSRESARQRQRAEKEAARIAAERRRILDETAKTLEKKFGSPAGGQKGVPATKEFYGYLDRLTAMLYQQWNQPTSTALKKRGIFVLVTLQIAADGTVQTKNFKPSGNAIMDQSVQQLLQKLRAVPPPPGGQMTIPVKLVVSE